MKPGIRDMVVKRLTVGILEENCYVLGCEETRQAVLVDPGDSASSILKVLEEDDLRLVAIINTHAHFDHVLAVNDIVDRTGAPFHLHRLDVPTLERCPDHVAAWLGARIPPVYSPDVYLEAGQILEFGTISLEVRFTPGHAPGHVVFVDHGNRMVFAGDTLFRESIGRFDLPGADGAVLIQSIRAELLSLEDDFTVLPGHGDATTVGHERRHNPYVGQHAHIQVDV